MPAGGVWRCVAVMPAGARRSLASPAVVNGVLCQCGGVSAPPSSPSASSSSSGEAASWFLAEHERRLYSLFVQLDVNRDGALCVHDLAVGLERLGLHRSERDLWDQFIPPPAVKRKKQPRPHTAARGTKLKAPA
ncbi:calcium-binding mitochondrial carrier protein SCaMC-2-like [Crotalus adamanteus]|uniref:Calcium-binding mitochondrial carrier protein SCaMC-2-like n=1 Tax=Crotalus adamanteus TaxID=8729 RepID=A0AAW1BSU3_CROAD